MKLGWIVALVVLAAGCKDPRSSDADEETRCATFTELVVTDDGGVLDVVNTHGDARLELWRVSLTSTTTSAVGYAPMPDGSYVERWSFERNEQVDLTPLDFNGDDYADALVRPWGGTGGWAYYPMGPDGEPAQTAVALDIDIAADIEALGDFNEDGVIDYLERVGDDLQVVDGSTGVATMLGLELGHDPTVYSVVGDPALIRVELDLGRNGVLGRITPDGLNVLWRQQEDGFSALPSGNVIHDDHLDMFMRRFGDDRELLLMRFSLDGTPLDERVIEQGVLGSHVHVYDFDGDGHRDLLIDRANGEPWFRFGDVDDGYANSQPAPTHMTVGPHNELDVDRPIDWSDVGIRQRADLDNDGSTELLIGVQLDDGRRQRLALGFELCR